MCVSCLTVTLLTLSLSLSLSLSHSLTLLSLSLSSLTAQSLLERLTHRIIFKLDDAALEIMCGLYARNQKLKLTPSDVQFLQSPGSDPSRKLRLLVPSWVKEVHALFFYFLQVRERERERLLCVVLHVAACVLAL